MREPRPTSEFKFTCTNCGFCITSQTTEGACPNCHVPFKVEWQARYTRRVPLPSLKPPPNTSEG